MCHKVAEHSRYSTTYRLIQPFGNATVPVLPAIYPLTTRSWWESTGSPGDGVAFAISSREWLAALPRLQFHIVDAL